MTRNKLTLIEWYRKIIEKQTWDFEDYIFDAQTNVQRQYNLFYSIYNNSSEYLSNSDFISFLGEDLQTMLRDYIYVHSGKKFVNPMLEIFLKRIIDNKYGNYDYNVFEDLSYMILRKYGKNWESIFIAYNKEYNPLENYSMVETTVRDNTHKTTYDTTNSSSTSASSSSTGSESDSTSASSDNNVYGFNTSSAVPTATANGNNSSSKSTEDTTENSSSGTVSKTGDDTLKIDDEETLTRSGNIGVTTSQQMLQSELELRKYDLIERIFNDIDKELCLSCY